MASMAVCNSVHCCSAVQGFILFGQIHLEQRSCHSVWRQNQQQNPSLCLRGDEIEFVQWFFSNYPYGSAHEPRHITGKRPLYRVGSPYTGHQLSYSVLRVRGVPEVGRKGVSVSLGGMWTCGWHTSYALLQCVGSSGPLHRVAVSVQCLLTFTEGDGTAMGEPIMAASHCSVQSGWVVIHYGLMFSRSMQTTKAVRNHSWEGNAWQRQ